jgi:predicted AAA+ superfamily ATPase
VGIDRRNKQRREEVLRSVVNDIVHNAGARVTIEGLKEFLKIPEDGARRIVDNLVSAGILYEVSTGVWVRVLNIRSPPRPYGTRPRNN